MKKIAIFDLDGTLIDTAIGLNRCMNEALAKSDLPPISIEQTREYVGNGIYNYVVRAVARQYKPKSEAEGSEGVYHAVYDEFIKIYSTECTKGCSTYKGIEELLTLLKQRGLRLALLSNKAQTATDLFYMEYLSGYSFDVVLGQQAGIPLKPAPDGLNAILSQLKLTPEEAVMIGDGETDYLTAKAAKTDCISVLWGYRSQAELKNAGASVFAATPLDVLNIIQTIY